MKASVLGGRSIQISGEGFTSQAQDQFVYFINDLTSYGYSSLTTSGDAITRDFAYKSQISSGILYYELPSLTSLLGETVGSQITSMDTEIFVAGPASDGSTQRYTCDASSDCTLTYGLAYTPFVKRIYPSTVYAGQDICFNVFTDYAVDGDRGLYDKSYIGEYPFNFETYDDANVAAISTWNDYQICGNASGALAALDNSLTLVSGAGEYWISEWAKSFDGTSEYLIRTIPSIKEVTHSELYKALGGIITIKGDGFSNTPSENTVTVDDVNCNILEASDTQIRCQLEEKTTVTSGTEFVGGMGAHVKEYKGYSAISSVSDSTTVTQEIYYTDIESRRNTDDEDNSLVRIIEYWFVPPKTGGYIFHASCDDYCTVDLSTVDGDSSSAANIISVGLNAWRNFYDPSRTLTSSQQSLEEGKHYYMKVSHQEGSGDDYLTIGFTLNDTTTSYPNIDEGWRTVSIDPNHDFEIYEVTLPADDTASYRLVFGSDILNCTGVIAPADVFQCNYDICTCVTSTFTVNSTATQFREAIQDHFNRIRTWAGSTMSCTKETLDANGLDAGTSGDPVDSYKFTCALTRIINGVSSTSATVVSDSATVGTVTRTQDNTMYLSGNYQIAITLANGTTLNTDDLSLSTYNGGILRYIYTVAPELIGKMELKVVTSTYPTYWEGKELYYRIKNDLVTSLQIVDSSLAGGNSTTGITFPASSDVGTPSNLPFFEVIPGPMVRAYTTSAQVLVSTNGISAACPVSGTCDVSFTDNTANIRQIDDGTEYKSFTFMAETLTTSELKYVSIGTMRTCDIEMSTVSSTYLKCNMNTMIAGTHDIYVQTSRGAIKNDASITPLEVEIVISNLDNTDVHTGGGQILTITGDYFPESLSEANSIPDFAVSFNDTKVCTVTSVSKTQIVCSTPAGLDTSGVILSIMFNGKTASVPTTITVTASTNLVIGVDKPVICPVLKQDLVIEVSNLPSTDPDDYAAIIQNVDTYIKMRVNSIDSVNKKLTARFPGSPKNAIYDIYIKYTGSAGSVSL